MAEESKLTEKLEEKESEKKFTEEEMTKVTEFKNTYINIQQALGQFFQKILKILKKRYQK